MTYDEARTVLESHDQAHVLAFWEQLDATARAALLEQIAGLPFENLARMQHALATRDVAPDHGAIAPAPVLTLDQQDAQARERGERALREGKVGVIVVAGGQGSRLGYDGPKGCFPTAPISHASLFEIHCRKILALQQVFGAPVPFYIMTSQANDAATREYLAANDYFGLSPDAVTCFKQGMWPAMSGDGKLVLDSPGHIFMSPDGHGGILDALRVNGMLADMATRGLESLFYFQVDNALVEIGDPMFIGLHLAHEAQVSSKLCTKRDPFEGLGVVVMRDGRTAITEYTELTEEQATATDADGGLRYRFGSVAIHVFSLAFLRAEAAGQLPLHVAHKKVPTCDAEGNTIKPDKPNAYKFEKFIFDVLPDAERALNVEFAREDEFSPIKNAEGQDSPAMARRDMVRKMARWLEACGVDVPAGARVEIDPCYARSAADLEARLPDGFEVSGEVLLK